MISFCNDGAFAISTGSGAVDETNVRISFAWLKKRGAVAVLTALKTVKKGEEILVNYCQALQPFDIDAKKLTSSLQNIITDKPIEEQVDLESRYRHEPGTGDVSVSKASM